MAYNRGGLMREIYRGYVRRSPLGRDDDFSEIASKPLAPCFGLTSLISAVESEHAQQWPPLLLLADLYTQALLTMGDDEFFSSGNNPDRAAVGPAACAESTWWKQTESGRTGFQSRFAH